MIENEYLVISLRIRGSRVWFSSTALIILTRYYRCFYQSLRTNAGIVTYDRPLSLSFTCLKLYCEQPLTHSVLMTSNTFGTFVNLLNVFKNLVRTLKGTQRVSFTKISWLIPFRKIVDVHTENSYNSKFQQIHGHYNSYQVQRASAAGQEVSSQVLVHWPALGFEHISYSPVIRPMPGILLAT
jgi:hypothetical protein